MDWNHCPIQPVCDMDVQEWDGDKLAGGHPGSGRKVRKSQGIGELLNLCLVCIVVLILTSVSWISSLLGQAHFLQSSFNPHVHTPPGRRPLTVNTYKEYVLVWAGFSILRPFVYHLSAHTFYKNNKQTKFRRKRKSKPVCASWVLLGPAALPHTEAL